eukprot:gnl/Dysnectes_brevis/1858_a2131_1433.p1 GENE.gnl/Dysnectes_brevis/1858_a2131_1433~~gnl/Dysnectes_brevis/1858_a2131_1433.p1  ORF type:complete len:175 (+),score=53.77 gnl/Dysnectes_brevis/1858_a2131_1433:580-1104(+)
MSVLLDMRNDPSRYSFSGMLSQTVGYTVPPIRRALPPLQSFVSLDSLLPPRNFPPKPPLAPAPAPAPVEGGPEALLEGLGRMTFTSQDADQDCPLLNDTPTPMTTGGLSYTGHSLHGSGLPFPTNLRLALHLYSTLAVQSVEDTDPKSRHSVEEEIDAELSSIQHIISSAKCDV